MAIPEGILVSLHYGFPVAVFLYFAVASAIATCTLQTVSTSPKTRHARPRIIVCLLLLVVTTYIGQLVAYIVEIGTLQRWPTQDTIIGLLSCILVFGIQQVSLGDGSSTVWYPLYGSWLMGVVIEPCILMLSILGPDPGVQPDTRIYRLVDFCLTLARYTLWLGSLLLYFAGRGKDEVVSDDEQSLLLPKVTSDETAESGYGTNTGTTNTESNGNEATNSSGEVESSWERRERLAREKMEKRLKEEGSWFAYVKGFMIFFPYVWPSKNRRLQLHAVLVGVCLLANNALNVFIPRQMGIVLDTLGENRQHHNPWLQILIFCGLKLLASEAGINYLQQLLWLPVEYYSNQALSVAAYSHVMNLSAEFHDAKSSSDLMVAISNSSSISSMLESICFQAVPMLVDLFVAFVYLSAVFGPYEGFITVATGVAFIQAATHIITKFKEKRKQMVKCHFEEHFARQAGIQGWHTVTSFNQTRYEEERYKTAVQKQITTLKSVYTGYMTGQALQYLILLSGLIAGAFLAVYQVTNGQRSAGDFAMLLAYWGQLSSPLRFFASLGRQISRQLVYAERLLDVMLTRPTVVEKPDARPLVLKGGRIDFRNVNFSYDKKKGILKGVKLSVAPGETVAFVGATGAGKSTILRLLGRFYDVTGGSILIDGQDIRDVQISSLRQRMGLVPQAPILFDDTIINNVRYARLTASDEEVYAACQAAAIHDHIMSFTEGYRTRVGERGVKISGGELQRIAIARAILKNPDIVLLDEATSSVDTDTEQKIQEGLRVLCQGRTTLIVAHRLSTVMNADVIFVVANGEIVEHGSHEELLDKKGKYCDLWSKQIFVKAKETKKNDGPTDQSAGKAKVSDPSSTETHTSGDEQTSGTADTSVSCSSSSEANPVEALTPRLSMATATTADGKADDQAKTPSGHKKEGSRLNPGAAEFTPRSTVSQKPRPVDNVSPSRSNWADDVEAAAATHAHDKLEPVVTLPPPVRKVLDDVANENIRPGEANHMRPDDKAATTTYRLQEPLGSTRTSSGPLPPRPSTPTPSKTVPSKAAQPVSTHQPDQAQAPRGRSRGYRGHRGHGHSQRGRGRNTSNSSGSAPATSSTASRPK